MAGDLRVETLSDAAFNEWSVLVRSSPDGSVYQLPAYLEAMCAAAGGRFCVLAARYGDELVGGVAVYERESRYGPYVSPRRLLYYNGPVLRRFPTKYPSEQTARDLKALRALESALRSRGYARVTLVFSPSLLEARPFLAGGWSAAPGYTYLVDMSNPAAQWSRVEQNLRRLIGRGEREGLSLEAGSDPEAFHALHSRTLARKGQGAYLSREGFRRYYDKLHTAGIGRLFEARLPDGRVVASQLVLLGPGGRCHVVAAAAEEAHQSHDASAFLRWKALEALSLEGYTSADLTDASLNSVTHFKSQLGGELRMLLVLDAPRSLGYRAGSAARAVLQEALAVLRNRRGHAGGTQEGATS